MLEAVASGATVEELSAGALTLGGVDRDRPLEYQGLRERYLPARRVLRCSLTGPAGWLIHMPRFKAILSGNMA